MKWIDSAVTSVIMLIGFVGGVAAALLYPEMVARTAPSAWMGLMWFFGGILVVLYIVERKQAKRPNKS